MLRRNDIANVESYLRFLQNRGNHYSLDTTKIDININNIDETYVIHLFKKLIEFKEKWLLTRENIIIIYAEDLYENPSYVADTLINFLEIDKEYEDGAREEIANTLKSKTNFKTPNKNTQVVSKYLKKIYDSIQF